MSCNGSILEVQLPARTSPPARTRPSDQPLAGLAGSDLSERFRSWCGISGRRYIFSVFNEAAGPGSASDSSFSDAVVIAASRDRNGARRIVHIATTDGMPELLFRGRALAQARESGATEIHVHLLAASRAERRAIVEDLSLLQDAARAA